MIDLNTNETILKQDRVIQIHSAWSSTFGTLYLTNQRVLLEMNRWAMLFGLLGWLLAKLWPGEVKGYDRSAISSRAQSKHGINENVMLLKFSDGQEWKLGLTAKYAEWDQAFQS